MSNVISKMLRYIIELLCNAYTICRNHISVIMKYPLIVYLLSICQILLTVSTVLISSRHTGHVSWSCILLVYELVYDIILIVTNLVTFVLFSVECVSFVGDFSFSQHYQLHFQPPHKTRRLTCEKIPGRNDGQTKLIFN